MAHRLLVSWETITLIFFFSAHFSYRIRNPYKTERERERERETDRQTDGRARPVFGLLERSQNKKKDQSNLVKDGIATPHLYSPGAWQQQFVTACLAAPKSSLLHGIRDPHGTPI